MLRKILAISFALSLLTIFATTESPAQTRVKFEKGTSSGTIKSAIEGVGEKHFVINAFEGQEIRVKIMSQDDNVMVEGEGGLTENIFDAVNGDNKIRIYNISKSYEDFTAVFTVTDIINAKEKQVMFDKGKSSKTIQSTIGGNLIRVFVLNAREEQVIEAKITSKNKQVMINEEEGARWLSMDSKAGDNKIEIVNKSNVRSAYTLTFTIKDKKLPPPTRISFAKGKSSKTIDLVMNPYQKSQRFVIRASKGQMINIEIETKDTVERIAMNLDNAVDNEDEWLDGFGYLQVTTGRSDDYIFEVIKLDEKYLSAKMKVSIKNTN